MRVGRYGIVPLLILGSSIDSTALAAGFYISEVGTPGSLGSGGVINPTNTFTADAARTNPTDMAGLDDDAAIDQTQQGVRTRGEFDTNIVVFIGATMNYKF